MTLPIELDHLVIFTYEDAPEAQALEALGFDLRSRLAWRESAASPFGLMFRKRPGLAGSIPFPTRRLRAEWMPGEFFVNFAADVSAEPYYGVVPNELSYPSFKAHIAEPAHTLGIKELTSVKITVRRDERSPIAALLIANDLVTIHPGDSLLMELTFDAGMQGKTLDVRPTLPLVLAY